MGRLNRPSDNYCTAQPKVKGFQLSQGTLLQKGIQMNISAISQQPNLTTQTQIKPTPSLKSQLGQLDFSHTLAELDLDGDGQISQQEFDFYRSSKAARGEFIPTDGPNEVRNGGENINSVKEALFHKAMEKGQ